MEATLFTSFGLLLALMMKKPNRRFSIVNQIDMVVNGHNHSQSFEQTEKQQPITTDYRTITPEKKKKQKKKGKNSKMEPEVLVLYPRYQQTLLKQRKQKQAVNKIRSRHIGRQIQAIIDYFLDDIHTILPFNGISGSYTLNIPIPGATYSDIPIQIKITESYPLDLPNIELKTNNLHPLEKQKLQGIIKQQQQLFQITKFSFLSNLDTEFENPQQIQIKSRLYQPYLSSYYYYIFNLSVSISQQLFYRPEIRDNFNNEEVSPVQIKQNDREKNSALISEEKNFHRIKEQLLMKKEILQNVVEQILNRDDDQFKDKYINQNKPFEVNISKLPNPRGRYKADYEQLDMIGQGGFGRVYRCKHRVDSNIYAVKKMVINYNDPKSFKLLKEVAVLSKLNHPNIVRYHQSWLEDTSSVEELIADMKISDPEEINQFNRIWNKYSSQHPSSSDKMINEGQSILQKYPDEDSVIFGDDIIFGDYSSYPQYKQEGQYKDRGQISFSESFSKTHLSNSQQITRKHSQIYEFPFKILYIVMQYCGSMTLKDFINNKFNEPYDVKIKLIRSMLEGLSYIHSKRIIHRDLKPANIFLIQNINKVKIGDFGLATIGNIQNNPYEAEIIEYSEKTRGVGTTFYRAPQQVSSNSYDEKVDIYALGIILLELFYQFETNMQRYEVLNEVTKTHKLPKDFKKVEQNQQFQEQIQSCLSVSPILRPTVEKLLQTFRNKYFTQLVSLIANPKHFQFYQLMNHLFGIKNETNGVMKQNLFRNYTTEEFIKIYQIHRGVLFSPLSLIPVVDFLTLNGIPVPVSRKQKFLVLSERGVVMQYPSNTYITWIRYAKQTLKRNSKNDELINYKQQYMDTNKQMRRFTFEKVSDFIGGDLKSQFSFKEKFVTAFDIAFHIEGTLAPYYLSQMLNISVLMIETMQLTQRRPPIYLCHSYVFKLFALEHNISLMSLHKFLISTTDQKFRTMKNQLKLEELKNYGLEGHIAKKIISLLENQYQNQNDFLHSIKIKQIQKLNVKNLKEASEIMEKIEEEISILVRPLQIFKLYQRVKWKIQIPQPYTQGLFWSVGPVKGFTSIEEYLPGEQMCNLHLQTFLNQNSQQNEAQVSVWSNGQFLQTEIMEVVAKCWQNKITVKWQDQNLGQKDLSCRLNIIIKRRNDRVYMMLRKNNIAGDRLLEKKVSEEVKDKEESAFILKQNFNYQVLKNLTKQTIKKY